MLQVPTILSQHGSLIQVSRDQLQPVIVQTKPFVLTRCWKAVVKFVKNIFKYFSFHRETTPFDLSRRQIRLIRQAQVDRTLSKQRSVKSIKPPKTESVEDKARLGILFMMNL